VLLGAHVSSAGGISSAIDRAEALGCDAVQVFTQSPRMWRPTAHSAEQVERFRARRAEAGIGAVACHAVYLVNLASLDPAILEKSVAALRATLETARAIGAESVVFHVGSHLGAGFEEVVERVVPPLRGLLELTTDELWLCMENCAGTGGTIGRTVAELAALHDALDSHPRLGVCLDSCHWWASGVDVTDAAALDGAVVELDERIGLDRLRCLHVNDSKTALGSNRDRHDNVGSGLMGEGLATFLAHPAFQRLPALLETPGSDGHGPDAAEMERLRALYARATGRKPRPARSPARAARRRSGGTSGGGGRSSSSRSRRKDTPETG
jgi:deoxyribonuclease-4